MAHSVSLCMFARETRYKQKGVEIGLPLTFIENLRYLSCSLGASLGVINAGRQGGGKRTSCSHYCDNSVDLHVLGQICECASNTSHE